MRHLFLLNNNTTYIVAREIIRSKNLKLSDCVYLLGDETLLSMISEKSVDIHIFSQKKMKVRNNFWITWVQMGQLLLFILKIIKLRKYILYTAHSGSPARRIISRFPFFCKELNYIEEGLLSYSGTNKIKKTRSLRDKTLVFLNFLGVAPLNVAPFFYADHAKHFYALNDQSFVQYEDKRILLELEKRTDTEYSGNAIIALSRCYEINWITLEKQLEVISLLVNRIGKGKTIRVKCHPRQDIKLVNSIKEIISRKNREGYRIFFLDSKISIELLLATNEDVQLYSDFSSLLIYAVIYNQQGISFYNLMKKYFISEQSYDVWNYFPDSFLKRFIMLKDDQE